MYRQTQLPRAGDPLKRAEKKLNLGKIIKIKKSKKVFPRLDN